MCEDLENIEALQTLYSIAKNMFLLNSNAMLNDLLEKKYFKYFLNYIFLYFVCIFRDIVGMLEYDPSFPEPKKHREFLWERSKFREILPIKSEELKAKIHQTYRVQYVLVSLTFNEELIAFLRKREPFAISILYRNRPGKFCFCLLIPQNFFVCKNSQTNIIFASFPWAFHFFREATIKHIFNCKTLCDNYIFAGRLLAGTFTFRREPFNSAVESSVF